MSVELKDVGICYIVGDVRHIGFKDYVIQKLKGQYDVKEFWAVDGVSFRLERGDFLGIVGKNGAGKSTLLKAIAGITRPTRGELNMQGSVVALLELGSGFDGEMTVRENTFLRGALLGYTREFMNETYNEIISFAELEEFQDRPFRQLSSGMKARLAFSIACLVRPEILILDEVLSVGDGAFKQKSEAKMKEIISNNAITLFVSHSVEQTKKLCNKVLWLDKGKQVAFGDTKEVCNMYEEFIGVKKPAKHSAPKKKNKRKSQKNAEKRVLFPNRTKAQEAARSLSQFKQRPDYEQLFSKLVSELDGESRMTIVCILKRMEIILGKEGPIDLFTKKEQEEARKYKQYLNKNVLKISDSCFCMGEFMLPNRRFGKNVFFDKCGINFIRNIEKIKNKCIIDAGTYAGASLLIFNKLTDRQVHCFEATAINYELLEKTIEMNHIENAVPVKMALGAECGKRNFDNAERLTTESDEVIDIITLDEYAKENNLEIGLIKADAENMLDFITGAKKTICEQKPVLIISIYRTFEELFFIKPEIESWKLGYNFKIHKTVDGSIRGRTILIAEVL